MTYSGAVVGMNVNWSGEPDYIQSAEARVGSYLTSDYGRVACNSKQIDAHQFACYYTPHVRSRWLNKNRPELPLTEYNPVRHSS